MKLKNIFISGLGILALTSCNDYLEVDAPSKFTPELIYGSEKEINTALNGVYAKILVNNLFGNALYNGLMLNSDVDFATSSGETANENAPRRFDMRPRGNSAENLWNACYSGIESANEFIHGLQNSELYSQESEETTSVDNSGNTTVTSVPQVTDLTQKMGEAKVIRAMLYHELLSYYGDVPFAMEPTSVTNEFLPDVKNRTEISDAIINDLIEAANFMYSDRNISDAPERISKEACWAMIARMALQAGGYSLNHIDENGKELGAETYGVMTRPENYRDYYKIARDYAKKVIDAGGHSLTKPYRQVFIDECNLRTSGTNDDPIFEIPFGQDETGNWGYAQGPAVAENGGNAPFGWGVCNGGVRTSSFYWYDFEEGDTRRDFVCGMWDYSNTGLPVLRFNRCNMFNNKWSKLWNENEGIFGASSTGSTGINFAYIRYADVLLMFAEADNEWNNGPTPEAIDAVNQVRARAFERRGNYQLSADATASKEAFLKAVLDERKLEFAGENMRWKDLVRNNLYAKTIYYTFLTYFSVGASDAGFRTYFEEILDYTGKDYDYILPTRIYAFYIQNPNDGSYPNSTVPLLKVMNPYTKMTNPTGKTPDKYITENDLRDANGNLFIPLMGKDITGNESDGKTYAWVSAGRDCFTSYFGSMEGGIRTDVLYSLYGYIRGVDTDRGDIVVIRDGVEELINPANPSTVENLPVLRYLMPYPQEIVTRSAGKYQQYYGYK